MKLPGILRASLLVALAAASCGEPANEVRKLTPAFTGRTMAGERFSDSSLRGKPVLIQFWATWCGMCRRDQEAVNQVVREYTSRGLTVLAVSVGETRDVVETYLKDSPRLGKIIVHEDTTLPEVFRPRGFPSYLVLDKDGRIAAAWAGAGGLPALRDALSSAGLAAGRR